MTPQAIHPSVVHLLRKRKILMPEPNNIFRDDHVHVCREMCSTCIFRPGNQMHLPPGRVKGMIKHAHDNDGAIVCHSTLDGDNAVCRGFFDLYPTRILLAASAMDIIQEVDPPCFHEKANSTTPADTSTPPSDPES